MCQAVGKCARLQANVPDCRQMCQAAGKCARQKANVLGCRRMCQAEGPVNGVETCYWGKNGEEMHRCIVDSSCNCIGI